MDRFVVVHFGDGYRGSTWVAPSPDSEVWFTDDALAARLFEPGEDAPEGKRVEFVDHCEMNNITLTHARQTVAHALAEAAAAVAASAVMEQK